MNQTIDPATLHALFQHMESLYPGAARTPSTPLESSAQSQIGTLLSRVRNRPENFQTALTHIPTAHGQNLGNIEPLCAHSRKYTNLLTSPQKLEYRLAIEQVATPVLHRLHGQDVLTNTENPKYGKLWQIDAGTRSYVRLLSDITYYRAELGEWDEAATWGLKCLAADERDNCKLRDRVGAYLVLARRYQEAVNFAMNWLTGGLPVSEGGLGYDWNKEEGRPKYPAEGLNRRTKESLNPNSPLPQGILNLDPHAGPPVGVDNHSLLCNLGLSLFHLFDQQRSTLGTSALILADSLNKHTLRILLASPSTYPKSQFTTPRSFGSKEEASDYVFFTKSAWITPEVRAWMEGLSADEEIKLGRRNCTGCEKMETRIGEWKGCGGCQGPRWFCGTECQRKDWTSGHRQDCKRIQRERQDMARMAGYGV